MKWVIHGCGNFVILDTEKIGNSSFFGPSQLFFFCKFFYDFVFSFSRTKTDRPALDNKLAVVRPHKPEPITMTSHSLSPSFSGLKFVSKSSFFDKPLDNWRRSSQGAGYFWLEKYLYKTPPIITVETKTDVLGRWAATSKICWAPGGIAPVQTGSLNRVLIAEKSWNWN